MRGRALAWAGAAMLALAPARALAAAPPAPPSPRVLVLAPTTSGVSRLDEQRVADVLADVFARRQLERVEPPPAPRGDEGPCVSTDCLNALARELDVDAVIHVDVLGAERDYEATITTYKPATGSVDSFSECFVCGFDEFVITLERDLDALAARSFDPAQLTLTGLPARAKLDVDDSGQLRQEHSVALAPGEHHVDVRARGFLPERVELDLEGGSVETRELRLTPVPGRRRRMFGAVSIGLGAGALGAAVGLLALHGRDVARRCDDPNDPFVIDADGDCRWEHDTLAGGAVSLALGVGAIAAGATLMTIKFAPKTCKRGGSECDAPHLGLTLGPSKMELHGTF